MKKKPIGLYAKIITFILFLIISFKYNAYLGTLLISAFVLVQLYLSRGFIYVVMANNQYARGNKAVALNWYKKASVMKNCKPRVKNIYGYILIKEGLVEEADKVLKEIGKCKLDAREDSQYKLTYALVKWKQGDLDGAISLVEDVHKNYRCSTAYESLGYLLILKGDYERALQYNLEAFDYNNSNDVILDNLGETYYYLKDYDKASEIYEKLVAKNPTFPEPYYFYGLILTHNGKKEEALKLLEKAMTLKESFLSSLNRTKIQEAIENIKKPE